MSVTIKLSTEADTERTSPPGGAGQQAPPQGDVLLAEVNGRLLAAIGMDGTVDSRPVRAHGRRREGAARPGRATSASAALAARRRAHRAGSQAALSCGRVTAALLRAIA